MTDDAGRAYALRAEVAQAKGLTPAQAKWLRGTTKEAMEADADEMLQELLPAKGAAGAGRRTHSDGPGHGDLRGGGRPDEEPHEMDPRKLAEHVGRS